MQKLKKSVNIDLHLKKKHLKTKMPSSAFSMCKLYQIGVLKSMFLKPKDVAKRYQIGLSTVYKLSNKGQLPKPLRIGKSYRWTAVSLEEFERSKVVE